MDSAQHVPTSRRSRATTGHKIPLILFGFWVICELGPSFIPLSVSDVVYWNAYLYSEDLASLLLAAACYTSLSYTSVVVKGVSLSAVVIAGCLIPVNIMSALGFIPKSYAIGILLAMVFAALQLFLVRFILRIEEHSFTTPRPETVYLIINKPRSLPGMLGLLWSGIGGGFTAYVDGQCYWFSRKSGTLVKEYDPQWYRGKRMINCGAASDEKIADLEGMIGKKWSIWNNCFTVFGAWKRRWS